MEKTEILPIDLDRTVRHFVRRVRRVHEAVDSPAAMAAALERVLESWSGWWRQNSTRDRVARHLYALMLEPAPADDPFYFLSRRALWDLYRRVAGLHRKPRRGDVLEYRPFGEVKARYRVERLERHVCFIVDEDTGETTQFIWGFPEDGALNAVFSIVGEARDAGRRPQDRRRPHPARQKAGRVVAERIERDIVELEMRMEPQRRRTMTKAEREEFRVYCEQCTDDQLREVLAKEQKAADAEGNVGFRSVCAAIAEGVALARGIAIVALCAVLAAGYALVHDAPYAGEPVEAAEASRGAPPTEEKAA